MSDPQVVEWIPHEGQKRVLDSKARFIFSMGGKRGGKTTAGCYWSEMQMEIPNSVGLIAAPTFDQLTQSVLVKFFSTFPQLEQYYYKKSKMLALPNGSKVYVRSLDMPGYIEGLNLNWAWVDEADGLNYPTWLVLRGRVATTLGRILMTTTIYPNSWIYDYIYKAGNKDMVDLITWESLDNPSFPKSEWDALKRELDPVIFEREYQSKFVWGQGLVYQAFSNNDVFNQMPDDVMPIKTFIGLDFGWNDPTAIIVMQFCSDGRWYVVDEHYKPGMNIDEINYWLEYFDKKYNHISYTIVDPQAAIPRFSLNEKMNVIAGDKDIASGISLMRNTCFQHRLKIKASCYNTIREIKSYEYQHGQTFLKEIPEDKNNHALDAIRYVLKTASPMVDHLATTFGIEDENKELPAFWQRRKNPERRKLSEEWEENSDFIY
jgi:PBSX family phage terminase large subunit